MNIKNNKKCKITINNNHINSGKTADEMFKELGYEKFDNHPPEEKVEPNKWVTQDCRVIQYKQSEIYEGIEYTLYIRFHIVGKRVEIGAIKRQEGYRDMGITMNPILKAKEIQAINKKCDELGWLNGN